MTSVPHVSEILFLNMSLEENGLTDFFVLFLYSYLFIHVSESGLVGTDCFDFLKTCNLFLSRFL